MKLARVRACGTAMALAVCAWAAGCGTPRPMIEPVFAARAYTPARIAVLPPAVFMVYDEYGDNDPQKSGQLGQAVTQQMMSSLTAALQQRGYGVNLQSRWDGIYDGSGQLLVPGSDLGWLASSIVQFANSDVGGGEGPMDSPNFIAPELARKVGWATQSDALLYLNMKGVVVSPGKRTAQVVGTVLFLVVIAVIIAAVILQSRNGEKGGGSAFPGSRAGGGGGPGVVRAAPAGAAAGSAFAGGAGGPTRAVSAPPVGRGSWTGARGGGRTYRSPPRVHSDVHVGVGVFVPLVPVDSPQYTHDGQVADDDDAFDGDQIHLSMTLVSAQDGRVLWHIRDSVDVEADKPQELDAFVRRYVGLIPPSLAPR
jgi:hypothetical protein